MKSKTTRELVFRLTEVMRGLDELELKRIRLEKEHDDIIYELWDRIPSSKNNEDLQPKVRRRVKDE